MMPVLQTATAGTAQVRALQHDDGEGSRAFDELLGLAAQVDACYGTSLLAIVGPRLDLDEI